MTFVNRIKKQEIKKVQRTNNLMKFEGTVHTVMAGATASNQYYHTV